MNWTTNKPMKAGWYWWRKGWNEEPTLVEVTIDGYGFLKTGPPSNLIEGGALADASGEWGGRVEMPP